MLHTPQKVSEMWYKKESVQGVIADQRDENEDKTKTFKLVKKKKNNLKFTSQKSPQKLSLRLCTPVRVLAAELSQPCTNR